MYKSRLNAHEFGPFILGVMTFGSTSRGGCISSLTMLCSSRKAISTKENVRLESSCLVP